MLNMLNPQAMSAALLAHVESNGDWIGHGGCLAKGIRTSACLIEACEFLKSEDKMLGGAVTLLLERLVSDIIQRPLDWYDAPTAMTLISLQKHIQLLLAEPLRGDMPWKKVHVSPATLAVPTMLIYESMRYYKWLGRHIRGTGRIVELGAWLGSSTRCLCEGLASSGTPGNRIHVYDSFIWDKWMDPYIEGCQIGRFPQAGEDFFSLFMTGMDGYEDMIIDHRQWVADAEDQPRSRLEWPYQDPISLLVYDMGPVLVVLEELWRAFSGHFIPHETLLVFNEYGKLQSGPLWEFCEQHSGHLIPYHKPYASTKTFLYV